jgi:hypothetical protein
MLCLNQGKAIWKRKDMPSFKRPSMPWRIGGSMNHQFVMKNNKTESSINKVIMAFTNLFLAKNDFIFTHLIL